MALVTNEIPTGTINGTNTVFTLVRTAYQMDDVLIDGASYTGSVIINGNQITLSDAPLYELIVDYYDAPPNNLVYPSYIPATTSVQTVIDNVLAELGVVSSNSVASLSETNMIRYVNSAHKELLNHPECVWEFMMETLAIDIKADSTLALQVLAAAGTASVSETSTWSTAGRVVVEGEEWNYTNNAADVLTIPASQATHPAGSEVSLCYAMPSQFQKPEELWIKSNASTVGRGIRYNYMDFRMADTLRFGLNRSMALRTSRIDTSGAYSQYSNNFFIHKGYLYLPWHNDVRYGLLKYSKKATTLTAVTDYLDVPDSEERLFDFIYDTVLGRCYKVLKRYDRMKEHMQLAADTLAQIVAEHQQKNDKIHSKQIKTYW